MSSDKPAIVSISDIFGIGKLAQSNAANRLVNAIISGVGEITAPYVLQRRVKSQVRAAQIISTGLPTEFSGEIDIGKRAQLRLSVSKIKHQENREAISLNAIEDLRHEKIKEDTPSDDIEQDWLEYFWNKSETVSDAQMQSIWSRVLARKAMGSAIGLRTLDILRTLSSDEAEEIQRLAAFKVAIGPNHPYWRNTVGFLLTPRIVLPDDKEKAPNRVSIYRDRVINMDTERVDLIVGRMMGNRFQNVFGPAGIYVESGFSHEFQLNWPDVPLPIQIGDRNFEIRGLPGGNLDGGGLVSFGSGIGFSQIGWEIFSLAKTKTNEEYLEIVRSAIGGRGLELVEV